jgi:5-oxoprolinase (ATP-hydrolysing)
MKKVLQTNKAKWQFWIDRGGTFTDIIAHSPTGRIITHKLLSEDPQHYRDPAIAGIRQTLKLSSKQLIPTDSIACIKMGTTITTNALLERKGENLVLITTQGFADALKIGYQNRPRLFELNIQLPKMLFERVIEVKERYSANGEVLIPLNEAEVYHQLQKVYAEGFRSVAIVFIHGYRYFTHEKKVAAIAKKLGFSQISVSHQISPVMKLVSRGDTTVVDAYLTPCLNRYITSIRKHLPKTKLLFMQSNGGLIEANFLQGNNSILSGPAGGVVGMIKTALTAGFDQVIGFDMGGTSTDISHYAGEYERTYEHAIAGIRLRAPMMLIHSIAAGGGSILHFENQRLSVGPDSAGALPGPACYRRNGPLTITDCNVIVGKIQAEFFPKVFGKQANQPLDTTIVKQKFIELTNTINNITHQSRSPEQIAEGFLTIAEENMANAIKKISVERGYNVKDYVLNCFGGASGQHACKVADALGIKKILSHPHASVLSAYGMGMAELRVLKQQAVEMELTESSHKKINKIFLRLKKNAQQELRKQDIKDKQITIVCRTHLRYEGSDTSLITDFADLNTMKKIFAKEHKKHFGFTPNKRDMIIEAVSLEAIARTKIKTEKNFPYVENKLNPIMTCKIFSNNQWHDAPVYDRKKLKPGNIINGIAIITEANTTIVVESGWQAILNPYQHLILTRIKPLFTHRNLDTKVDPVMLELFNNRFMAVAEQMGVVLRNTASSVNIKERLDFSCALFDPTGELIANAPHIPVHLGSMSESVKQVLQRCGDTIHAGDVYMLNAPYAGGTHLPDITVITPIFATKTKKILFIVASRGHHTDIGGITPGSIPPFSKTIEEEGILIDNFKIVTHGRFREKAIYNLLTQGMYPARNPQQNIAVLKAQIAANEAGVQALKKMVKQFGLGVIHAYMRHVRTNANDVVTNLLATLKPGNFIYPMDNGNQVSVTITIDYRKKHAKINFTGTSKQSSNNFNAPTAVCKAAILYVIRSLVKAEIPLNSGCLEPLDIVIPKNSLLNPHYPAAVVAGNVETSQCIVDCLLGAFNAVAAAQGTCNNITFGNANYQYYETICGGAGAGATFPGASAVHTHMTNTRLTDPEILEWRFPIVLEEFSIRRNSGGAGKFSGGDGVIRKMRFLEPMTVGIVSSHRRVPPYGLSGGKPGKIGHNWLLRVDGTIVELEGCDQIDVNAGDTLVIETPGGGGYGK